MTTQDSAGDPGVVASAAQQMPFIVIVCEGADLLLVYVNAATLAMVPGRDVLGRPLGEVFADVSGQQWIEMYGAVYETGEPVTGAEWRATLTREDGIHELYANFTISPWRRDDGSIRGVIGAGFDVTAAVRARQAAEQDAARLRRRYEQTRDVITALQQELLPRGVPVLPGLQIAASYLLADADHSAGGDWFDTITRPDGTVALVVGDVVGHGVAASGVMGQLRAVLHDRLESGAGIAGALAATDRFARHLPAAHATTVVVVVLDRAGGTLTYCTAGHPAPLVVTAAGATRYLPATGGMPLGTSGDFPVRQERLGPGDLILLYSDGILERPGTTLPDSTAELARVAAVAAAGRALHAPADTAAGRVCGQTVELLIRSTGHHDDITLLAAQRVGEPAGLELDLPAELASLRASRLALGEWLAAIGATPEDTFVLQLALGELITNAIEHGFHGEFGRDVVRVTVRLGPSGDVEARITDHGSWREPARQSQRGRGLALTSQLVGDLTMAPGPHGTTATVRHPLLRPAYAPAAPARPALRTAGDPGMQVSDAGPDEVRVSGPVDATSAAQLQHDLLGRSRGGNLPLTVDLSEVTHLASAGVSALHHVADQHHRQGAPLALYAAAGSPAQLVLDLVGLPHRVVQPGQTVPR
jgi:serine phosphatase RsbU (regulator of sigma subunit)/anti-sigma regulatory factor (Ser/Thr protein kinase)/anti-anti-sigma regulatory factor